MSKKKTKKKRTVIVLSRYDRSKHKERTATSVQKSVKKKKKKIHLSFWGDFWSVKVSMERGEHLEELMLLNTSNFFGFF